MGYYNRSHKKLKLDNMRYLNHGECAKVLCDESMIFKEYYLDTIINCRLSEKMFDILKDINNPHFIELFDIYSDFSFIELCMNKIGVLPFIVDAYTAKYYPDDSVNVLLEQKDYILDNFRELEILFGIFAENKICADDIKRSNIVMDKNGIIIIDPDTFYTMDSSKEVISELNKKELLYLLRSIFMNSVTGGLNYEKFMTYIDTELVNIDVSSSTDVAYEISKKLKYVKKPIELFKR